MKSSTHVCFILLTIVALLGARPQARADETIPLTNSKHLRATRESVQRALDLLEEAQRRGFAVDQALTAEAMQGAAAFRLAHQRKDGSWPSSRTDEAAQPSDNPVSITYFGSAWARLGLLNTLPLQTIAQVQAHDSKASTVLGKSDDRFTLNGQSGFLVGVSYYAGLGASAETVRRDLDDLQRFGFNWLRVWATWDSFGENVSALDATGKGREPYLQRLQSLVAQCDKRGMVVDVTLARSRPEQQKGGRVHLPGLKAHKQALHTIIDALKPHRNWYLDLANERDVGDDRFVAIDELKELRRLARELDASLLVTASFGGHDYSESDIRDVLQGFDGDFLAIHRPRHKGSPEQTERRTRDVLETLRRLQLKAPVHHQEPMRRGYANWEPTSADFLTDLRGALNGGAAGWCFHNGATKTTTDGKPRRSFDLREKRLMEQLDEEEQKVLQGVRDVLAEAHRAGN